MIFTLLTSSGVSLKEHNNKGGCSKCKNSYSKIIYVNLGHTSWDNENNEFANFYNLGVDIVYGYISSFL